MSQPEEQIHNCDMTTIANEDFGTTSTSSFSNNVSTSKSTRACPSPVSTIVGHALNQMNLKRSSSAPMINQLVGQGEIKRSGPSASAVLRRGFERVNSHECKEVLSSTSDPESTPSTNGHGVLSALTDTRPRRFSASFSPSSPGLAPNRVSQLRQENSNSTDWESASEKEFHGHANIAQSWEDLSLDSMSMEVSTRRPSFSDQLWLNLPSTTSLSASSSPTASPRIVSRFSPSLSSPSPTRKSFTSRRSLSPIAIRPSVLSVGSAVKRKCDWDTSMDCSPLPPKRPGGLLSLQHCNHSLSSSSPSSSTTSSSVGIAIATSLQGQEQHLRHTDSPNSIETESSISSNGDSPFFRPVDSPQTYEDCAYNK